MGNRVENNDLFEKISSRLESLELEQYKLWSSRTSEETFHSYLLQVIKFAHAIGLDIERL